MIPPSVDTASGGMKTTQEQGMSPNRQLSDAIGRLERRMEFTFAEAQRHVHDDSEGKSKTA